MDVLDSDVNSTLRIRSEIRELKVATDAPRWLSSMLGGGMDATLDERAFENANIQSMRVISRNTSFTDYVITTDHRTLRPHPTVSAPDVQRLNIEQFLEFLVTSGIVCSVLIVVYSLNMEQYLLLPRLDAFSGALYASGV